MNGSFRRLLAALAFLALGPAVAAAQKLEAGTWTGTVAPPDGGALEVTYEVKVAGDTVAITIVAAGQGSFAFNDVKVANGKLTFTWAPGPTLKCELALREDKSWAGPCTDPGGSTGQLTMIPPKKDPPSN
jgi:hypothetical protein